MKDDKKKLIVLGVLFAVILCVGAFSFLGGSPPPPAPVAAKKEEVSNDGTTVKLDEHGNPIPGSEGEEPPQNPLYAEALPQRDPFQLRPLEGEAEPQNPIVHQPSLPQPKPGGSTRRPSDGPGYRPYQPPPLAGSLPGTGGLSLNPSGPDPSTFNYTLSGTMTGGPNPVAVFTDSSGNQRLVPVGGSLDGDSKVVSVEKGSVTIEHRGKKQRLSQGGNPK
ncbi:MAG: hypothetical protein IT203_04160 [Fimbriimonadaceae bacterium]|nr:hypothetical protein [Fimbriimonadaceae bacterium]